MKKLKMIFGLILAVSLSVAALTPLPCLAAKTINVGGETIELNDNDPYSAPVSKKYNSIKDYLPVVGKTIIFFVGAISVLVLIYAGFTYITSLGDPGKMTLAKKMILYAIIGIVISIAAGVVVSFVVDKF